MCLGKREKSKRKAAQKLHAKFLSIKEWWAWNYATVFLVDVKLKVGKNMKNLRRKMFFFNVYILIRTFYKYITYTFLTTLCWPISPLFRCHCQPLNKSPHSRKQNVKLLPQLRIKTFHNASHNLLNKKPFDLGFPWVPFGPRGPGSINQKTLVTLEPPLIRRC